MEKKKTNSYSFYIIMLIVLILSFSIYGTIGSLSEQIETNDADLKERITMIHDYQSKPTEIFMGNGNGFVEVRCSWFDEYETTLRIANLTWIDYYQISGKKIKQELIVDIFYYGSGYSRLINKLGEKGSSLCTINFELPIMKVRLIDGFKLSEYNYKCKIDDILESENRRSFGYSDSDFKIVCDENNRDCSIDTYIPSVHIILNGFSGSERDKLLDKCFE